MRSRNMTDYLCAAVRLDREFRQEVLNAAEATSTRALAPNPGVEMQEVVEHAKTAARWTLGRDLTLMVLSLTLGGIWWWMPVSEDSAARAPLPFFSAIVLALALLFSLEVCWFEQRRSVLWHVRLFSIVRNVGGLLAISALVVAPIYFHQGPLVAVFFGLVGAAVLVGFYREKVVFGPIARGITQPLAEQQLHQEAAVTVPFHLLSHTEINPLTPVRDEATNRNSLTEEPGANLLVYRENTPFAYAGEQVGQWTVSLPLRPSAKLKNPGRKQSFSCKDLYNAVRDELTCRPGQRQQPQAKEITFVDTSALATDAALRAELMRAGRVRRSLEEGRRSDLPDEKVMHCLALTVTRENEELVITSFLHARRLGETLILGVFHHQLPVLSQSFCNYVDAIDGHRSLLELFGEVIETFWMMPALLLWAPIALLSRVVHRLHRSVERGDDRRRIRRSDPAFDYSAISLRTAIGVSSLRTMAQVRASAEHLRVVDGWITEAISRYLEDLNIDASGVKRGRRIVNINRYDGIVVMGGGKLSATYLAAGNQAKVSKKIMAPKERAGLFGLRSKRKAEPQAEVPSDPGVSAPMDEERPMEARSA